MVVEDVPIKGEVVPDLIDLPIGKESLECFQHSIHLRLVLDAVGVNPQHLLWGGAVLRVRLLQAQPAIDGETDDLSMAHRALALHIDVGNLRVTRKGESLILVIEHVHHPASLGHSAHDEDFLQQLIPLYRVIVCAGEEPPAIGAAVALFLLHPTEPLRHRAVQLPPRRLCLAAAANTCRELPTSLVSKSGFLCSLGCDAGLPGGPLPAAPSSLQVRGHITGGLIVCSDLCHIKKPFRKRVGCCGGSLYIRVWNSLHTDREGHLAAAIVLCLALLLRGVPSSKANGSSITHRLQLFTPSLASGGVPLDMQCVSRQVGGWGSRGPLHCLCPGCRLGCQRRFCGHVQGIWQCCTTALILHFVQWGSCAGPITATPVCAGFCCASLGRVTPCGFAQLHRTCPMALSLSPNPIHPFLFPYIGLLGGSGWLLVDLAANSRKGSGLGPEEPTDSSLGGRPGSASQHGVFEWRHPPDSPTTGAANRTVHGCRPLRRHLRACCLREKPKHGVPRCTYKADP
mmetsp:Transcript_25540/g.71427  ORF Transcript_25540/g.71427 Transcript_25540/m.71427 type:complete len:513 (-) Transcript_25540:70-1608(-)